MKKHHEENYIASAVIWAREHELMARLDNLEGCEDNPIYASQIQSIRKELASIRHTVEVREDDQGVTRCGACGAELLCNECGDMPDTCPHCGKNLGYNIYAPQSALGLLRCASPKGRL